MKEKSVWSKYLKEENNKLEENIEVDILIIGGGIAGVLTSFYLKDSSLKIALVERNSFFNGITSKMTAKVTILQDLLTKIKETEVDLYLKSQLDGMRLLKKNISDYNIECDLLKNDSYLFTTKNTNKKKLQKVKKLLEKNKIKYKEEEFPIKNISSVSSIKINESYEINPIKYLNEIKKVCKTINYYDKTNVIEVKKEDKLFVIKTDNNKTILAKKVIFATNYPYFLKPLFFPIKVKVEKSYIGYGESINNYSNSFNGINIDKEVHSIRFYKDKMIYLTGSRIISSKINAKKNFDLLEKKNLIKKIDNKWSNMDIVPNDYLPIVGKVFEDMYIITGFSAWGILSSHIGASMLASMILKKKRFVKYQDLFSPRKKINFQKITNSCHAIYESIQGYFKGIITRNKFVFYNKDKAIYIDSDGYCYVVKRKCPHLKCNLLFNEIEKTWDCPCHGSRFDLYGNVLSGPSKNDIKIDVN